MHRPHASFLNANPLLRLLAVNAAGGTAAALILVAGLYWLDVAGLQRLSAGSSHPWLPVAMLAVAFVITFASAAMGAAIMLLQQEAGPTGRGQRHPVGGRTLQPVPVRVQARRLRSR